MKIGILKEDEEKHDRRTPLTPRQCRLIKEEFPGTELIVHPCDYRCYKDEEYHEFGVTLSKDLSSCDLLMGIKEVKPGKLIHGKKYFYFSHTIKKQPHNREMMQTILREKITLLDYECLTDTEMNRVIGFGRHAGIIGSYNGILGYGKRYDLFQLKPAWQCRDREEFDDELNHVRLPNIRIIVTGGGRVANGVLETLGALKIRKVTAYEFLNYSFREPVYVQLHSHDYNKAKDGSEWNLKHFFENPADYESTFSRYLPHCDLLIHASYWDPKAPILFSIEDLRKNMDFRISVIADITCDINGSVPCTVKPSSIEEPFYGYNPVSGNIEPPFGKDVISVMAVPNLPCELPRDASEDFGKNLIERVFPSMLGEDTDGMIERAMITRDGKLMPRFDYLKDYAF